MTQRELEESRHEFGVLHLLYIKEALGSFDFNIICGPSTGWFKDINLKELPNWLPPLQYIKHEIGLILISSLLNLPHYHMNPIENVELNQVDDLLKGIIHGSRSSCAVPTCSKER